jgi:hypothetical protein
LWKHLSCEYIQFTVLKLDHYFIWYKFLKIFQATIQSTESCQNSTKILFLKKSSILKVFDNCWQSIFLCAGKLFINVCDFTLKQFNRTLQTGLKRNAMPSLFHFFTFWVVLPFSKAICSNTENKWAVCWSEKCKQLAKYVIKK